MSEEIAAGVHAAEHERCAAMVANDAATLDAILDPTLHFGHANGSVEGKDAYLAKMATGRILYRGISWSDEAVTPLAADIAMLTGRMDTAVQVDGTDKNLKNRVIAIWRCTAGTWRLIAFQSTPIAG